MDSDGKDGKRAQLNRGELQGAALEGDQPGGGAAKKGRPAGGTRGGGADGECQPSGGGDLNKATFRRAAFNTTIIWEASLQDADLYTATLITAHSVIPANEAVS